MLRGVCRLSNVFRMLQLAGTPAILKDCIPKLHALLRKPPVGTLASDMIQMLEKLQLGPECEIITENDWEFGRRPSHKRIESIPSNILQKISGITGVKLQQINRSGIYQHTLKHNGLIYSTSNSSFGDSLIMFEHEDSTTTVPGCIQDIYQHTRNSGSALITESFLAVTPFKAASRENPFASFPFLKATIWSKELSDIVVIRAFQIHSHFALYHWEDHIAVIPLSRVSENMLLF